MNERPRLLLAAQPLDGGVARHVVTLVRALPEGRFALDVACPRASLTWSELEGREDVTLHAIRASRRPAAGDAASLATLLRLVARADVVHAHSSKAGFLARLAAALRGRRRACLFTPHAWSFWAAGGAERELYVRLERAAARWCRTIVALSEAERAAGLEAGVGRPEQYRVVPNGIELDPFDRPRAPVPGRILFVGRLAPQKRPDVAVRALAAARATVPSAELHVAGDGPLARRVEALAAELGVTDAVRLLGPRTDVPELLGSAACLLLTSDYEGCPLTAIEAMAAGVPVVATAAPGVDELVEDGRTGVLAPLADARAVGTALASLLREPERAERLGAAGRERARRSLSAERMAADTVALYDEVLADRASYLDRGNAIARSRDEPET